MAHALGEGQWVTVQGRYSTRKVEDKSFTDINVTTIEALPGVATAAEPAFTPAGDTTGGADNTQDVLPF